MIASDDDGQRCDPEPVTQRRVWSGRKILRSGLKLLVTLALVGVCLSFANIDEIFAALRSVEPVPLVIGFCLAFIGTILLPAIGTRMALLLDRVDLSLREIIAINLATRFYVVVLPRVVSMGIRWYRYGRGRLSSDALALMGFERVVQLVTILVFALVALTAEYSRIEAWGGAIWLVTFAGTIAALMLLTVFLMPLAAQSALTLVNWGTRWLPRMIAEKLRRLTEAVTAFQHLPKRLAFSVFCLSALSFLCFVSSAFVISRGMGLEISFIALVWVRSLVFILTLVPIAVAGVGLREIGFVGLLGTYGIAAADAVAFSLLNFSLQLALAALGVVLEVPRLLGYLSGQTRHTGENGDGQK